MKNEECQRLLPLCLKKCLHLSDSWHESTKELYLYRKVFSALTLTEEGRRFHEAEKAQKRRKDIQSIMSITHDNIDQLATIEMLESQNDVNVKMAPSCKIRCHVLFTAAVYL